MLKADEAGEALEISYDPEGLFPDVDETSASMLIDKNTRQRELALEKKDEEEKKEEHEKGGGRSSSAAREARACSPPRIAELVGVASSPPS